MKKINFAITVCALLAAAEARATIAYDNAGGIGGLQDWGNNLGLVFYANQSISITSLGAFDNGTPYYLSGANGYSGVTVQIYELTSWNPSPTTAGGTATGTAVGNSVTFTPGNPGTQVNGDAFLPDSINLAAGHYYTVVAYNDVNYNSNGGPNPYTAEDSGGGAITFEHYTLYNSGASGLSFPTTIDNWNGGGPSDRYAAGTFEFSTAVPETSTIISGAMMLLPLGASAMRILRKRAQA